MWTSSNSRSGKLNQTGTFVAMKGLCNIICFLFRMNISRERKKEQMQAKIREDNKVRQAVCREKKRLETDQKKQAEQEKEGKPAEPLVNSVHSQTILSPMVNPAELAELCPFSEGSSVIHLPKSYQKRASEFFQLLPDNDLMLCSVVMHTFLRVLKTYPQLFTSILLQNSKFLNFTASIPSPDKDKENIEQIQKQVRRACLLRNKRNFKEIANIQAEWEKSGLSRAYIAKVAAIDPSHLAWVLTEPEYANKSIVSSEEEEALIKHVQSNMVSQQLPTKRYAKHFFLRGPLKGVWSGYSQKRKALGKKPLPFSTAAKYLKKQKFIKCQAKTPWQQVLCSECENFNLLLAAAHRVGIKGLEGTLTLNCLASVCKSNACNSEQDTSENQDTSKKEGPSMLDAEWACVDRRCKCKMNFSQNLREANTHLDTSMPTIWHQWDFDSVTKKVYNKKKDTWENKTVRLNLRRKFKEGTIEEVIGALILQMSSLARHLYLAKWQAKQFEECKDNLQPGEVLQVLDFAKNLVLERQREIHTAFYYRHSATLHPIVCYYKCPCCDSIFKDEFTVISSDMDHDAHAVHTFVEASLDHLREQGVQITRVIQFSDNCGYQYKSVVPFHYISLSEVDLDRSYFGPGHGKGPADSVTGRFKLEVSNAVKTCRVDLVTAVHLYFYCKAKLQTKERNIDLCPTTHSARHFHLVRDVDRSLPSSTKTLNGTQKVHFVRSVGTEGMFLYREVSCYCR